MQNNLQTTYTFTAFEPNKEMNAQVFAYRIPDGYKVVEKDPGQIVAGANEASAISGFSPLLPTKSPLRIFAFDKRIVLDYGDTTVVETPAAGPFEPAGYAASVKLPEVL